jgi:hypothetical protein
LPVFVGGRRLRLIPVIALAIGLAACGGSSDKAQTLPPLSSTPSTTPSIAPTQTPKAAAAEAVRNYFRARNELATDVRAVALAAVTTPDCACRELVRSARLLARQHRHYFGHAAITQILPTTANPTKVQLFVRYNSTAGGVRDAGGKVISHDPPHLGVKQVFVVELSAGRWRVASIVLLKSGS